MRELVERHCLMESWLYGESGVPMIEEEIRPLLASQFRDLIDVWGLSILGRRHLDFPTGLNVCAVLVTDEFGRPPR